jgi:glucose/arabinose dehydrogenase
MWNAILRNAAQATLIVFCLSFTNLVHAQPTIGYQPFISSGISGPIEVVTAPGDLSGRLFIVEKSGIIRIWNGTTILPTPFLNISGIVEDGGEQGLLSMAFHPQYQTNRFFFVYYNDNSGNVTVARYQTSLGDPNVATPTANPVTPFASISKPFDNHNGGHLQFRVEGGTNYLYFATGDGGSGNDPNRNAQNPASRLGKMLRINVDAAFPPAIETYAWGLRNPFRWSFDRANGDIWIGDVGQGLKEEVSYLAGGTFGANYGWPCFEGTLVNAAGQSGSQCDTVSPIDVQPIFEYDNPPSGSSSIVGGYVYRGTEYPSLQGYYMTVDFYSGQLWLIRSTGPGTWAISGPQSGLASNISSISETNDGSTLYAVSLTGNAVFKIVDAVVTPVMLTNFSGRTQTGFNELKWTTASEINIQKYTIEYSSNGRDFTSAGDVAAQYTSGGTYTYQHRIVNTITLFYRLKIVENDGRHSYSAVISLGKGNGAPVVVYPTVVSNGMLNIVSGDPVMQLDLYGTDGKRVFGKNINGQSGYMSVSLPSVSKGVYYLRISGRESQQTKKIIIQ